VVSNVVVVSGSFFVGVSTWALREIASAFDCQASEDVVFLGKGSARQSGSCAHSEDSRIPCSWAMAWKWGLPGFLLSTQDPNGFRESTKAPMLGADAETELGASARATVVLRRFSCETPLLPK
jgi:hypothetical protein